MLWTVLPLRRWCVKLEMVYARRFVTLPSRDISRGAFYKAFPPLAVLHFLLPFFFSYPYFALLYSRASFWDREREQKITLKKKERELSLRSVVDHLRPLKWRRFFQAVSTHSEDDISTPTAIQTSTERFCGTCLLSLQFVVPLFVLFLRIVVGPFFVFLRRECILVNEVDYFYFITRCWNIPTCSARPWTT